MGGPLGAAVATPAAADRAATTGAGERASRRAGERRPAATLLPPASAPDVHVAASATAAAAGAGAAGVLESFFPPILAFLLSGLLAGVLLPRPALGGFRLERPG
jgi:hypothetical protein